MRESGGMTCASCGKRFTIRGAWGYAYGGLYVCSYKCMRKMQAEDEKRMAPEIKEQVRQMLEAGIKATEIADKLGIKAQAVYDYRLRYMKKDKPEADAQAEKPEEKPAEKKAPEKKEKAGEAAEKKEAPEKPREPAAGRYTVGWMCPCCRMVWNPWISTCNCQRRGEKE